MPDVPLTSADNALPGAPARQPALHEATSTPRARLARLFAGRRAQTALALVVALLVHGYFFFQSRTMVEGDEALLGVQAERILRGEFPIYMYGQAYMASWEAYLAAPLVALFGPSAMALHAVTFVESLLLVPLMGALAVRMFASERARLPAMLLAAVPPVYVGVVELHTWGGYIETMLIGAAMMLVSLRIAARWAEGAPAHVQWLLAGLLVGFGWWIDPLIIYYLTACALWLGLPALVRLSLAVTHWGRERSQLMRGALLGALAFVAGALVSDIPALLYQLNVGNAAANGSSAPYFASGGAGGLSNLLKAKELGYFALIDAPRVAGIEIPWSPFTAHITLMALFGLIPALVALVALVAGALVALGALRVLRLPRAEQRHAITAPVWMAALPVILAVMITIIFWRSPATIVLAHGFDSVGRYAAPLTAPITLLLVWAYLYLPTRVERLLARWKPTRGARVNGGVVAMTLLALALVSYAAPYAVTNQIEAMESPFSVNLSFPSEHAELITYLTQRHITDVWADHWIGNVILYLTDGRIQAADYYDVVVLRNRNRFPEALINLTHAIRPTFIYRSDTPTPWTITAMRSLGVPYEAAQFGDISVVTPLTRTVAPIELAQAGCGVTPLVYDQLSCAQVSAFLSQPDGNGASGA